MQDIINQIFRRLSKGIYDVDIQINIYEENPSLNNLAEIEYTLKMENLSLIGKLLSFI